MISSLTFPNCPIQATQFHPIIPSVPYLGYQMFITKDYNYSSETVWKRRGEGFGGRSKWCAWETLYICLSLSSYMLLGSLFTSSQSAFYHPFFLHSQSLAHIYALKAPPSQLFHPTFPCKYAP